MQITSKKLLTGLSDLKAAILILVLLVSGCSSDHGPGDMAGSPPKMSPEELSDLKRASTILNMRDAIRPFRSIEPEPIFRPIADSIVFGAAKELHGQIKIPVSLDVEAIESTEGLRRNLFVELGTGSSSKKNLSQIEMRLVAIRMLEDKIGTWEIGTRFNLRGTLFFERSKEGWRPTKLILSI